MIGNHSRHFLFIRVCVGIRFSSSYCASSHVFFSDECKGTGRNACIRV